MQLRVPSLALILFAACGPRADASNAAAAPPSIELSTAEFFDYQGGQLRAHGFADTVFYRRDTGDANAAAARIELSGRRPAQGGRGGGATWIQAPTAVGNPLAQSLDGSGGVTLRSESGDRGSTDRASYRGQEGRAFGKSPVAMSGPGYQLRAPGFTLDTLHDRLDLGPATLLTRGPTP
jgi:hypothetical protein